LPETYNDKTTINCAEPLRNERMDNVTMEWISQSVYSVATYCKQIITCLLLTWVLSTHPGTLSHALVKQPCYYTA